MLSTFLPPRFDRRVVTIASGDERPYVEDDWRDALVLIEQGEVDLVCTAGGHRTFGRGDMVWFDGLSLHSLRNRGDAPTVLVAISRG